jgi:tetratricopeptide (TPR) repeat protein
VTSERLVPGDTVGDLVIERVLGRGAFGAVYLALDRRLGRRVALKVLLPSLADLSEREGFLSEARILAGLASPQVVTLYRLHDLEGGAWGLEMEFVDGHTLSDEISDRRLTIARVETVLLDLLSGLGAAHARGILHRDIKPANVLVGADGTVKLTDFGLARLAAEGVVADEGPVGTPRYMAPEVLLGAPASVRSDLWSLGVVAFEMLAGRSPFPLGDLSTFFSAVQNAEVPPLPAGTPLRLSALVATCLARDQADRVESCAALRLLLTDTTLDRTVDARVTEAEPELIGRDHELSRADVMLGTSERAPRALLVGGEAGSGKSAFVAALRHHARKLARDWIQVELTPSRGLGRVLIDAFQEFAARTRSFAGGQRLIEFLAHGRRFESVDQMIWASEQVVEAVTGGRPFVLCVDDAHHMQEDDFAVLAGLVRRLARHPWFLLAAARPSPALARMAEVTGCERLELGGLSREDLFALLQRGSGGPVSAELASRIASSSGGNPLIALELLRHAGSSGAGALPARLQDLVAARLETCSDEERSLLEAAAVDGVTFDGHALAQLLGLPLLTVLRTLQRLCRGGMLLVPAERGYRFTSPILQEALYAGIAPELRAELHRLLAVHLEAREGIDPERLARHWTECGEPAKAAPYWITVAAECGRRLERRRMLRIAERAGLLDPELPGPSAVSNADLILEIAAALSVANRADEAQRLLDLLRAGAQAAGNEELAVRVEVLRARSTLHTGRGSGIDEDFLRGATERLAGTLTGAHAHYVLGVRAKFRNDVKEAERHLRLASGICSALGEDALRSNALDQLGSVALRDGRAAEAEGLYAEAATVAERAGRRSNVAVAQVNRVTAAIAQGRRHGLVPILESAIRTMELAGQVHNAAQVKVNLAALLLGDGKVEGAGAAAADAVAGLRKTKYPFGLCVALRTLGSVERARGRFDEALAACDEALLLAGELGDRLQSALTQALRALACVESGREAEGAGSLQRAAEAAPHDAEVAMAVLEAALLGMAPDRIGAAARHIADEALAAAAVAVADGSGDAPAIAAVCARLRDKAGGPTAIESILAFALEAASGRDDGSARREGAELAGAAGFVAWRDRFARD